MKQILIFTLLISFAVIAKSETKGKIEVPLRFDRYYNYDEVNEALKALNKAYPEMTKLEVVGKSEEGREIYALTINNSKTGEASGKPGVYVDGNIHGNEIQAGEVCLYYANMLLTKYGENEKVTKAVDRNAHYILPVVNVDGRYRFFWHKLHLSCPKCCWHFYYSCHFIFLFRRSLDGTQLQLH